MPNRFAVTQFYVIIKYWWWQIMKSLLQELWKQSGKNLEEFYE